MLACKVKCRNYFFKNGCYLMRFLTTETANTKPKVNNKNHLKMCGWEVHNYGGLEELQFSHNVKIPKIRSASECLVRVCSTSINPIDCAMLGGYGAKLINKLRCSPTEIEFPLILGREFCGELLQCGFQVNTKKLCVGERVWGVVPLHSTGCHAEYVVVPDYCLSSAPSFLSNNEATSVLYAGLTAWSGLYITGHLGGFCGSVTNEGGGENKRILVLGGSGSVGSIAIQMLKSQGAVVIATCAEDAMNLVRNFGADVVLDYNNPIDMENMRNWSKYDIVLDCAGQGSEYADKINCTFDQYITFSSPMLRNIDKAGLGIGMFQNAVDLLRTNAKVIYKKGGLIKWGFFAPIPQGIEFISRLVDRKKILPTIDSNFQFNQLPEAFKRVNEGHLRGKVTVTII